VKNRRGVGLGAPWMRSAKPVAFRSFMSGYFGEGRLN
jgi:hypothetical protein